MADEKPSLGERIQRHRKAKAMTLEDVAETAGVSKGYLSQLENGKETNPTVDVLGRIAKALDTTIAALLGTKKTRARLELPDTLPPGLEELVREYKDEGHPLDDATVAWLANARFRGSQKTKEDYAFLLQWLRMRNR
jgi:transcriptional regulator with XRE-family HTH domain